MHRVHPRQIRTYLDQYLRVYLSPTGNVDNLERLFLILQGPELRDDENGEDGPSDNGHSDEATLSMGKTLMGI